MAKNVAHQTPWKAKRGQRQAVAENRPHCVCCLGLLAGDVWLGMTWLDGAVVGHPHRVCLRRHPRLNVGPSARALPRHRGPLGFA